MEEMLERIREKVNVKARDDEKFQDYISGKEWKIQIDIPDGTNYFMELKDNFLGPVTTGDIEEPNIVFSANLETFTGIMKGEVKLLRAYALKQFRVKASFRDIALLRKIAPSRK